MSAGGNAAAGKKQKTRVRHTDFGRFAAVAPYWAHVISHAEDWRVFVVLCSHADRDSAVCDPDFTTRAKVAHEAGMASLNQISRAIKSLERLGAIEVTRVKGHESTYRILSPADRRDP